jgi:hypothetical protein
MGETSRGGAVAVGQTSGNRASVDSVERSPHLTSLFAAVAVAAVVAGCGSAKVVKQPIGHQHTRTGTTSATSATGSTAPAAALAADDGAQQLAQTASTAAMNYGNDNNGNYSGMTAAALVSLDASIQLGPGGGQPYLDPTSGVTVLDNGAGYSVTATSTTGDTFSVGESATGTPTQSCTGSASSACTSNGNGGTGANT